MSVLLNVFILTAVLSGILAGQEVGGCPVFPKNNIWNARIDELPVHPSSDKYIASNGVDRNLHADFGTYGGLPYTVVPRDQKLVPITFIEGAANSDPGPYPIPPNPAIEVGSDAHGLFVQQGTCKLFEVYEFKTKPDGSYTGYAGAVFDLRSNALRPDGWTSADAAGLPVFPGLVRYEEIEAGEIKHAIRLTVPRTRRSYEWPGRHFASQSNDDSLPAMGQRFRLKASYDISRFNPKVQVLLRALQRYGMMVADNGQSWFLTGTRDERWTELLWNEIKQVKGSDLEAVDVSSLMVSPNTGQAASLALIGRQEIAFSETPVFDIKSGNTISLRLAGDVQSSTVLNVPDGVGVTFLICQDDQGGRSFHWPSNVSGGMRVGVAPRTCSAQQFTSDGQRLYATSPGVTDLNQE